MTDKIKHYIAEDGINCTEIDPELFPMPIWKLLVVSGLCKSGNEARRLIQQGGVYIMTENKKETEQVEI